MAISEKPLQPLEVKYEHEDYEKLGIMPWFNYLINLPERPLPSNTDRPQIKTERLLVRPFLPSDAEAFHSLRSVAAIQTHSTTRGRTDHDIQESRDNIEKFQSEDQHHWYFGAFLQSTGELIGEGGLPDLDGWRSGRPEGEILIKPGYQRQGYGTELWKAVTETYWELPREKRRYQLCPAFVSAEKEPGDEVADAIGFVWEDTNTAARRFFGKLLGQASLEAAGFFVDYDRREGREGNLVRWEGTLAGNPRGE
ncbi:acyl-CoA N-acyltransferase [Truncatella angustata]|uniref:Acyl-CoA N-acyltransferase n=1 Tax=Truncatella angustata TaxID=152316 RepID=A0A9P8UDZ7_9PEZI|nr:acyl-CoA N-acyltransferase [Truncatella angustata]KAH6648174.1 acyl-CoA N-acyltransferase [Truncatella angustata]